MTALVVTDCVGLWRRTLLVEADGSRDESTDVAWLQGITAYVDSRGFAGRLSQRGDVFEWSRAVDLQPPSEHPDAGRMRWEGSTLIESGVHADYVEHWVRDEAGRSPCWGLMGRGPTGDYALLLRVGGLFGWASSSQVLIAEVDGPDWQALGAHLTETELRAGGGRWKIARTEGIVDL
ncbi:hypothetical protein [Mycolicibacterium stellerae]|uniref:hypothetical protein n=1 Tax=Mycolicibacterium stellerae TaxID=2358193 RepID=UPI000F0B6399|nr:hypothetical protein [Mycolicibacterium stellerae]